MNSYCDKLELEKRIPLELTHSEIITSRDFLEPLIQKF